MKSVDKIIKLVNQFTRKISNNQNQTISAQVEDIDRALSNSEAKSSTNDILLEIANCSGSYTSSTSNHLSVFS